MEKALIEKTVKMGYKDLFNESKYLRLLRA
jgi:hypothetical protein